MSQEQLLGEVGVKAVGLKVLSELGWLFREQPTLDTGIDAIIEVVEDTPTGQLIAAQIKTGASYFKERNSEGYVFRGKSKHLNYWLEHSLPVIVILFDAASDTAYWEHVSEESITPTQAGWKMIVPFTQQLGSEAATALRVLTVGDASSLRLRELRADRPWMKLLEAGKRVFVEIDEWVNKTSGRGDIRLIVKDESGDELAQHTWYVALGLCGYAEELPKLFPWADLDVDESRYEDAEYDQWEEEEGIWDSEDGVYIAVGDFQEWRSSKPRLRPYGNTANEVDHWRLELSLNDLGRSFLVVDDHLSG